MLNRKDPIDAMTKLVDACSESSRLFFVVAAPAASDSAFQQVALTIWQKLHQFEFELKREFRRLGGIQTTPPRFEHLPKDRTILACECESSLQVLVQRYEEALDTTLSAHARAMITRQLQEIREVSDRFAAMNNAA